MQLSVTIVIAALLLSTCSGVRRQYFSTRRVPTKGGKFFRVNRNWARSWYFGTANYVCKSRNASVPYFPMPDADLDTLESLTSSVSPLAVCSAKYDCYNFDISNGRRQIKERDVGMARFSGDYQVCYKDNNECLKNPCPADSICKDLIGSFTCLCTSTYTDYSLTGNQCNGTIRHGQYIYYALQHITFPLSPLGAFFACRQANAQLPDYHKDGVRGVVQRILNHLARENNQTFRAYYNCPSHGHCKTSSSNVSEESESTAAEFIVPVCSELVDCGGTLPTVPYGRITIPRQTIFQSSATVICNHGTILHGNSSVTCQANAKWSDPGYCKYYPGDRSDCHVMRGSKVSASFFTHKLLAVSGNIRTAATLQGAATACREVGFDILHYIPEGRCNSQLKNNAATRDMNTQKQQTSFPRRGGQKRQTYAIICQRPMQICPWYGTLQVPKDHDFRNKVTFAEAETLCRESNSNGQFTLAWSYPESRYCMNLLLHRMKHHFRMPTKPTVWWQGEGNEHERRHVVCRIDSSQELLPGAIERCGNLGTLQLPSYHNFKITKTFLEASEICKAVDQEIPVFSHNMQECMFKLLRKMRVRIGYASLPQVWFNRGQKTMGGGNMDEIARRHVVCFVTGSQNSQYTATWPNVELVVLR